MKKDPLQYEFDVLRSRKVLDLFVKSNIFIFAYKSHEGFLLNFLTDRGSDTVRHDMIIIKECAKESMKKIVY